MSIPSPPIPLVLLAGGSRRYDQMPAAAAEHHPLSGYKAAGLQLDGSPLIRHVCKAFAESGAFGPIYIAGPHDVYETIRPDDTLLIDTDGNFGQNLQVATEHVATRHPGAAVAYATADVLPSPEDLSLVLADLDAASPYHFWMLECRYSGIAKRLGTSTYKPKYWIRGDDDERPVPTLPGHLVIARPDASRRHLMYDIFDIAYNTRNTSIGHRLRVVTIGIFSSLLKTDWRRLRQGKLPCVTFEIMCFGLIFAFKLWRGIDHRQMAALLTRIFLHREDRRDHPERRGRVAVLDTVSLARDVDTHEEARELGLDLVSQVVSEP